MTDSKPFCMKTFLFLEFKGQCEYLLDSYYGVSVADCCADEWLLERFRDGSTARGAVNEMAEKYNLRKI